MAGAWRLVTREDEVDTLLEVDGLVAQIIIVIRRKPVPVGSIHSITP